MSQWLLLILLCLIVFFFVSTGTAREITGKCVKVLDGDTIHIVNFTGQRTSIRLYGIDCPELDQIRGQAAKQYVTNVVARKKVTFKKMGKDSYNRLVGLVYVNDLCLNEALLKDGFAWLTPGYCRAPFCKQWKRHEKNARQKKLGLWADPSPVAPWVHRHKQYKKASRKKPLIPVLTGIGLLIGLYFYFN